MSQEGQKVRLSCPPLYLVLPHLPGEGVAVHAEGTRGFGQAAVALGQHARDEALLEFPDRIVELDAAIDNFLDEAFEPIADHDQSSSRPVRRWKASTYFSRVFATTSSGSEGTGGCLFQRIRSR